MLRRRVGRRGQHDHGRGFGRGCIYEGGLIYRVISGDGNGCIELSTSTTGTLCDMPLV